jgi:hypothetical protein
VLKHRMNSPIGKAPFGESLAMLCPAALPLQDAGQVANAPKLSCEAVRAVPTPAPGSNGEDERILLWSEGVRHACVL